MVENHTIVKKVGKDLSQAFQCGLLHVGVNRASVSAHPQQHTRQIPECRGQKFGSVVCHFIFLPGSAGLYLLHGLSLYGENEIGDPCLNTSPDCTHVSFACIRLQETKTSHHSCRFLSSVNLRDTHLAQTIRDCGMSTMIAAQCRRTNHSQMP